MSSQAAASQGSFLVPIRVDVNFDKILRVVDTFLLDPNVWPIPRPKFCSTEAWIEANARYLASQLIADIEVIGMTRSGSGSSNTQAASQHASLSSQQRQFIGRLDLTTQDLHDAVVDQIQSQLVAIVQGKHLSLDRSQAIKRKLTKEEKDQTQKVEENEVQPVDEGPKRAKLESETKENSTPAEASVPSSDPLPVTQPPDREGNRTQISSGTKSSLIPIRLRLSVHGVRIHDDFDWDPNVMSALDFAQILGNDLNLSEEAIQAVAIDIAEQVQGLAITHDFVEADDGGPTLRSNRTAAWGLPQRVHVTNIAHLVANHRG